MTYKLAQTEEKNHRLAAHNGIEDIRGHNNIGVGVQTNYLRSVRLSRFAR